MKLGHLTVLITGKLLDFPLTLLPDYREDIQAIYLDKVAESPIILKSRRAHNLLVYYSKRVTKGMKGTNGLPLSPVVISYASLQREALPVSRCESLEIRVFYRKLCSRKRGNSLSVHTIPEILSNTAAIREENSMYSEINPVIGLKL